MHLAGGLKQFIFVADNCLSAAKEMLTRPVGTGPKQICCSNSSLELWHYIISTGAKWTKGRCS